MATAARLAANAGVRRARDKLDPQHVGRLPQLLPQRQLGVERPERAEDGAVELGVVAEDGRDQRRGRVELAADAIADLLEEPVAATGRSAAKGDQIPARAETTCRPDASLEATFIFSDPRQAEGAAMGLLGQRWWGRLFLIGAIVIVAGGARPGGMVLQAEELAAERYCPPDRADVLRIAGTAYYFSGTVDAGSAVAPEGLGPARGTVTGAAEPLGDCRFDLNDGEASVLAIGTEVLAIKRVRPTFRVAVVATDGRLKVYESAWSLHATTGEDLRDVRGRVVGLSYGRAGYCDDDMCVEFDSFETSSQDVIDLIVNILLDAPVDPDRIIPSDPLYHAEVGRVYLLVLKVNDGTATRVTVSEDVWLTSSGIRLPAEFSASLTSWRGLVAPIELWGAAMLPRRLVLPADTDLEIHVTNSDPAESHHFTIDALGIGTDLPPFRSARITLSAAAGTYAFSCDDCRNWEQGDWGIEGRLHFG